MRREKHIVFQNYEKHRELICRYVIRRMPGVDRDALFQTLNLIWKKAAENEWKLGGESEKGQVNLLLQIADQVLQEVPATQEML